jgi:hypothetical protein
MQRYRDGGVRALEDRRTARPHPRPKRRGDRAMASVLQRVDDEPEAAVVGSDRRRRVDRGWRPAAARADSGLEADGPPGG